MGDDRNGFAKALLFWKSFRTQFPDAHLHSKQYVMLVRAAASGGVERPELIMPLLLPKRHEAVGPIDETVACLDGFNLPMSVKRPLLTQLERQASRQDQLKIDVASQKKLDNGKSRQNVDENIDESLPVAILDTSSNVDNTVTALAYPESSPAVSELKTATDYASTPHDRLSLIGGAEKIIERMSSSQRTRPNQAIFIELLHCLPEPGDVKCIKDLLGLMDRTGVRPGGNWILVVVRYAMDHAEVVGDEELETTWQLIRLAETRGIPLTPTIFLRIAYRVKTEKGFDRYVDALRKARVEPTAKMFVVMFRKCGYRDFELRRRIFSVMTEEFLLTPGDEFRRWVEEILSESSARKVEMEGFVKVYKEWLRKNRLKWGRYDMGS